MTVWQFEEDSKTYTTKINNLDFKIKGKDFGKGLEWIASVLSSPGEWNQFTSYNTDLDIIKNEVELYALHQTQVEEKNRVTEQKWAVGKKGPYTIWGQADSKTRYNTGINFYTTPRHGGFKLSDGVNEKMPEYFRNAGGWYEEDCEWAKVCLAFPTFFTNWEIYNAEKSLRSYDHVAWEAHFHRPLEEGESRSKDEVIFKERHKNDYIVISASMVDRELGEDKSSPRKVKVYATIGGDRELEAKQFIVMEKEYAQRSHCGFVIDLKNHQEYQPDQSLETSTRSFGR